MIQLISMLLGFFTTRGPIAMFFVWIGKKIFTKSTAITAQITIVILLFTAKIAFLSLLVNFVLSIYNAISSIIGYIDNLSLDSNLSTSYKILESIGLIDAIIDVFDLFNISFTALLIYFVTRYLIDSLKMMSDEFYKIGVLLNL